MREWRYTLSGLQVRSQLAIPFAENVQDGTGLPDVSIRLVQSLGEPDPVLTRGRTFLAGAHDFVFRPSERLGFRVRPHGIDVARGADVPDMEVLTYLLGSGWGALCHLRALLPLHCSAVADDGRIFAFTGRTTVGKSTLAVALALRGFAHAADDIIVADATRPPHRICGLAKGVKLSPRLISAFRLRPGLAVGADTGKDKLYLDNDLRSDAGPFSRMTLFVLDEGPRIRLEPVTGPQKFAAVFTGVFRRTWMGMLRPRPEIFRDVASLSKEIDVFRFTRPRELDRLQAGVEMIADHIRSSG